MKRLIRSLKCLVGIHEMDGKCANVKTDSGKPITLGWHECPHCGQSKLKIILSNWEGTTP